MQVLLLGGHGKVALQLTPLLLARSWNVTSVIRNAEHENEILALGKGAKGKLNVLLSSLDDVKSDADAKNILDRVSPDYVVWSAGMYNAPKPCKKPWLGLKHTHNPIKTICITHPPCTPASPAQIHTSHPTPPNPNPLIQRSPKIHTTTTTQTNQNHRSRRQRRTRTHARHRRSSSKALSERLILAPERTQIPPRLLDRQSTQATHLAIGRRMGGSPERLL